MKLRIFFVAVLLFMGLSFLFAKQLWPSASLGGGERLFFDEQTFVNARNRIDTCKWAENLYGKLAETVHGGYTAPENPRPMFNAAYWAELAAIYYRISGDEQYLPVIRRLIVNHYRLDKPETRLFSPDPHHRNPNFWQRIMESDCRYLLAYDLVKNHQLFRGLHEIMNARMDETIDEAFLYESQIIRLGNTHFWGVTGLGMYGFMRNNAEAIETAINGKNGFKALLAQFRDDGSFWPEPKGYASGYVDCCVLILAEMARFNGWKEDLYAYEDPKTGASVRKMILSLIQSCTPDGYSVSNGETSELAIMDGARLHIERPAIFTKSVIRENTKLPVYYSRYKDPVIGWAMKKFPENDGYCVQFWNYSALLFGADVEETAAPSAESAVYPEMGDAIIRSDETPEYWNGRGLTVYFRNGASQQFHGENDHFSININAYGKHLFDHLFYNWDYLCPRKGRANFTPLSQKIVNHNTVVVDFNEPYRSNIHLTARKKEIPGVDFSDIRRSGDMKIISAEGEIYKGVIHKRMLGVTDEYVIDIFTVDSDSIHTYDYTLHSWGSLSLDGIAGTVSYHELNDEYGLGKIDTASNIRKDNVWFASVTESGCVGKLVADFTDGVTGISTTMLYEPDTRVIEAYTPIYISLKGWDDGPQPGVPERKPMLIVRRSCKSTQFIAVHQPYEGEGKPELAFSKKGNTLIVENDEFQDRFNMLDMTYKRMYKK